MKDIGQTIPEITGRQLVPPSKNPVKVETYFYAFTGPDANSEEYPERGLDALVEDALARLDSEFKDCKVILNPNRFHELRKVFGISNIPAIGITDINIESIEVFREFPPGLPHIAKFWRWKERKKLLASGQVLPKIERNIITGLANNDGQLFYFLRDLHIANVDQGINGIHSKIERELKAAGLESWAKTISRGKKYFFG